MSPTLPNNAVVPALDRGSVLLRFGQPSPFGEALLEFAGEGVLSFDPAAPDRLLTVFVEDPDLAPATLAAVLGDAAHQQLMAMRSSETPVTSLTAAPKLGLEPLARLALVSWLDEWSPLGIPRQAVLADVGTAALAAQHPLLALRSFGASADYLVSLSDRLLERVDVAPVAVVVALQDAVAAARAALGDEHPVHGALTTAEGRLAAAVSAAAADLTAQLQALHDEALGKVLGAAGSRAEVDADLGGLFSVDWAMVPGRVLSPLEGAGHMTVGDTSVTVTVEAARYVDPRGLMGLNARLVHPETGEVLAVAPLLRDPSGERFVAEFPYEKVEASGEALRAALPEVYSESMDGTAPGPRLGESRARSVAWRSAVTALTHLRRSRAAEVTLGGPLTGELESARGLCSSAELVLKGVPGSELTLAALRDWRRCVRGSQASGQWPTGLLVPNGEGISRPTLSEMIEVWNPSMFEVARP
jgi:hypothetical protein